MNQIQTQNPLFSALTGANGSTPNTTNAAARKDGTPAFAQWLNQSSQQLQTRSTDAQLQAQAQARQQAAQAAPAPQAPKPAQPPADHGTSSAAQDESKLATRNATARNNANKAEGAKAPARAANADGAAQPEAAEAPSTTPAKGDANAAGEVQARDVDGQDAKTAKAAKDGKDTGATAAEQILAMLRGDAPAEAKALPRGDGAADGDAVAGDTVAGHGQGKSHNAGDALRERQQLQRDLAQAAGVESADPSGKDEATQAIAAGGAHEIALGDGASAAHGPAPSFDALLAAAQAGAPSGPDGTSASAAPDAPNVPLSQPLDSPDFAPELSASVSLLIKDGIHEAQLSLNPTDMGPVSINIQLDGQQAQVNFHAQQAATREVLERSLPDLAAALQAQGLTLSGGGVFAQQQSSSGQNRGDGSADGTSDGRRGGRGGRGHGEDDGGLSATGRAERRTAPRGLVDLYA